MHAAIKARRTSTDIVRVVVNPPQPPASRWFRKDVPVEVAVGFGLLVVVLGLALVVPVGFYGGNPPDSIFGAATYAGVLGLAIIARAHPKTSQNYSPEAFVERAIAGAVVVGSAFGIDAIFQVPEWSAWVVYALTVIAEGLLLLLEIKRPASSAGVGTGTGAGGMNGAGAS